MPDPATVDQPWLPSYPPGVPATYAWPDVALPRLLDDAARDRPDLDAVRWAGGSRTWAEVDELASRVASALRRDGVGTGDRVAVALPNGPAAVVVAFGTWRAGAVLVLLDPDLPRGVRDDVLAASTPRVTVAGHDALPPEAGAVVLSRPEDWTDPGRWARMRGRLAGRLRRRDHEDPDPTATSWDDWLGDAEATALPALDPGTPAVLVPTGAATGQRRIVTLTHRNLVANAFQARLWVPDVQAGRERVLLAAPLTHPFGLTVGLLAGTLSAATMVVPPALDGAALADTIAAERPTLFPAVPALVRAIVDTAGRRTVDLSSLRVCLVGGAPLPPELGARFRGLSGQGRLREGHGLSEASPLTHANPVYGRSHGGRGGLPVTGTTSLVVDPADPTVALPPGTVGRLVVAGPQVMAGYWQDPDATAAVLRDGWLLTGDLAVMDDSGHVAVVDRLVDVAVTEAGVVFPTEVEAVLAAHPHVDAVRAHRRPTVHGTDEVVAQVVLTPDATGTADDLVVHCSAHLPPHAVPAQVDLVEALPTPAPDALVRLRPGMPATTIDQEVAG